MFRAEIQALRALAVAGVVVYHLWPGALPGGFIGVDVFFVISGFLITQQLVTEAGSKGRVALSQFWARRIRRILPAAFVVLLGCIVLVLAAMPRVTWVNNLSDIRAAAAYFENWQLGYHAVNYLAASNSPTVVQHYWSLSVEEQFYLAWPLLVMLAIGVGRLFRRLRLQTALVAVLATAAAASLVVSALWTASDPAMAFFATPTRAWEFAAGGLVAVLLPRLDRLGDSVRAGSSWLGLVVVIVSMFAITPHDSFPGLIALVPVAGAALVVAAALPDHVEWSPRRFLAWRPVQWVGDESYAIYLWHWPLIIAAPWMIERPLTWPAKVVILLVTLVLAGVTTTLVENPVRRGVRWRARRWPAYALAAAGVAVVTTVSADVIAQVDRHEHRLESVASVRSAAVVIRPHRHSCFGAAAMVAANHCTRPFARPKGLDTAFAAQDGGGDPCLQSQLASTSPQFCSFGQQRHPAQTVAIIGNSHAWRLVPALALYAEHHHWRIVEATRVNCLGLITTPVSPNGASKACLSWAGQVKAHLLAMHHLSGVIFASYRFWEDFTTGRYPTRDEVAATRRQILSTWSAFAARGVRVFVTEDVPGMRPVLDPKCIQMSHRDYDPCALPRAAVLRQTITTQLAQRHPSLATYLPLDQYFCDARLCHALIGGVVVYFDAHHMTSTFSRTLAEYLGGDIASHLG